MEKVPYLGANLSRWRVGQSTFLAWPEKGARLMNWNLTLGDGSVRDVLSWPARGTLETSHRARGGNRLRRDVGEHAVDPLVVELANEVLPHDARSEQGDTPGRDLAGEHRRP